MTDTFARRAGLAAFILACASVVLAPLNALARMRTESGRSDFENDLASWWAEPAMRLAAPVLRFGSPDTVYETYGKFYLFALLAVLACALAMWSRRPRPMRWSERWGWRLALPSYVLMAVTMLFTYWIANLDIVYLAITMPALLLGLFGHVLLGLGLVRAGFRPRITGWVLLLDLPLSLGLVSISTQALGMWPMMFAWGAAGWAIWHNPGPAPASPPRGGIDTGYIPSSSPQ